MGQQETKEFLEKERKNGHITVPQIAKALNLNIASVRTHINTMKKWGELDVIKGYNDHGRPIESYMLKSSTQIRHCCNKCLCKCKYCQQNNKKNCSNPECNCHKEEVEL